MGGFASVETNTVGIREQWGRFDGLEPPGCVWMGCTGLVIKGPVNMRTQQIEVKVDSFTKDNVSVEVDVQIQYKVDPQKVYEAFYSLENVRAQLNSFVLDSVRDKVPQRKLDHLLLNKNEVATAITQELSESMAQFGYLIVQVLIIEIMIDRKVKDAMNEMITAQRQLTAAMAKAEQAKLLKIKEAEADAAAKELNGKGLAAARQAIISGLRETVSDFTESFHGVDAETVMNLVLTSQYYDTMKEIGHKARSSTIFLPPKEFSPKIFDVEMEADQVLGVSKPKNYNTKSSTSSSIGPKRDLINFQSTQGQEVVQLK